MQDSIFIEASIRKSRLLWAWTDDRSAAKRLRRRVMLGGLEKPLPKGGDAEQVVPSGRKNQRTTCINNDIEVVRIIAVASLRCAFRQILGGTSSVGKLVTSGKTGDGGLVRLCG